MHKFHKPKECGGSLIKHFEDNEKFEYKCDKCGHIITQTKRKKNVETKNIYLHKDEWQIIEKAIDRLATSTVLEDTELFNQCIELRDRIHQECLPKNRRASLSKERKQRIDWIDNSLKKSLEG